MKLAKDIFSVFKNIDPVKLTENICAEVFSAMFVGRKFDKAEFDNRWELLELYKEHQKNVGNSRLHIIETMDRQVALKQNISRTLDGKTIRKKYGSLRSLISLSKGYSKYNRYFVEKFLQEFDLPDWITASKGKGALYNQAQHKNAKSLLKIDIKDYFNNINHEDFVKAINKYKGSNSYLETFYKYEHYLFMFFMFSVMRNIPESFSLNIKEPKIKEHLRDPLYRTFLPTGFPSSPTVANVVGLLFDLDIKKYLEENYKEYSFIYTRYIDDITISTEKEIHIVEKEKILNRCKDIISLNGFKSNERKTGWVTQSVSLNNIVLDSQRLSNNTIKKWLKPDIQYCSKHFSVKALAQVNRLVSKKGLFKLQEDYSFDTLLNKTNDRSLQVLKGKLNYLKQVNEEQYQKYAQLFKDKVYKQFQIELENSFNENIKDAFITKYEESHVLKMDSFNTYEWSKLLEPIQLYFLKEKGDTSVNNILCMILFNFYREILEINTRYKSTANDSKIYLNFSTKNFEDYYPNWFYKIVDSDLSDFDKICKTQYYLNQFQKYYLNEHSYLANREKNQNSWIKHFKIIKTSNKTDEDLIQLQVYLTNSSLDSKVKYTFLKKINEILKMKVNHLSTKNPVLMGMPVYDFGHSSNNLTIQSALTNSLLRSDPSAYETAIRVINAEQEFMRTTALVDAVYEDEGILNQGHPLTEERRASRYTPLSERRIASDFESILPLVMPPRRPTEPF